MTFTNPLVAGGGALVIPAIRSPNFQTGVRGWIIRRDGTAEFADVVIVGGELTVTDPDGSYVRIYDQNPGAGALIELRPADVTGHTIDAPAELLTFSTTDSASVALTAPEFDGVPGSSMFLGVINGSEIYAEIVSDDLIRFVTDRFLVTRANNDPAFDVYPSTTDETRLELDGQVLGFSVAGMVMLTPPTDTTTSSSFANISGATTFTFVKRHDATRVLVTQSHAGFAAGGAGARVEYGVNFSGGVGSFAVGRINYSELNVDTPGSSQRILTGIPAGSYTVTPCWRRESGTSTVTLNSGVSSIHLTCQEIIEA